MKTRAIKFMAMSILVAMVFYSFVALASIGRFSQTHAIVVKSDCTDCHIDSLTNLDKGKHIGAMGKNQSNVIDNFFFLKNSSDVQGLCYTCHSINKRSRAFGFQDLYIDSRNNYSAVNGIVFWNNILPTGEETENIRVNVTLESVTPENTSVTVDATVMLENFSGQQNASKLSTNVFQSLVRNESAIITRNNVYGDYFRIYLTASGNWERAKLNIAIEDPFLTYPILSIEVANGSGINYNVLPNDFPLQYSNLLYFHTKGGYNVIPVSEARNILMANKVNSFQSYEMMNDTVRNTTKYSCSSADTMCHINQRITDMGQRFGVKGERFYNHDMDFPDSDTCSACHI